MSDDFGTVNVNRVERAREIEAIRQHHRRHREEISKLLADAPSEHLAAVYRQLITEIDASISKLDVLEGREPVRKSEPGMRPLVTTLPDIEEGIAYDEGERDSRSRLVLIIVAAVIALALIAWLIWKASSDRRKPDAIVEEPATTSSAAATAPETVAEQPPSAPAPSTTTVLSVTPRAHDYGILRRGTRAVRQFEVTNNGDQPVTIEVSRSACRCLFYDYNGLIAPKAKETITVTIDGSRTKAGPLQENVRVSAKKRPNVATSFIVRATIQ